MHRLAQSQQKSWFLLYWWQERMQQRQRHEWDPFNSIIKSERQANVACRCDCHQQVGPTHVGSCQQLLLFLNLARVKHTRVTIWLIRNPIGNPITLFEWSQYLIMPRVVWWLIDYYIWNPKNKRLNRWIVIAKLTELHRCIKIGP